MIDTHTHLYFPEYGDEIPEIVKRATKTGITHFILPNVDEESLPQMKDFHHRYPEITSMAIGLHPTEVKDDWERVVDLVEKELKNGSYVAVGEVGMDLYWDKTFLDSQKQAFERQLQLAQEHKVPVIIHCRDAFEETMEIIEKVKPSVPLIFHSFTGNQETVKRIREGCDPYFGINGVVTYKNASSLRDALPLIGIEKILLETDSPYLTPVPHRGKRNESTYIVHVRDKVAETLMLSPEEVEKITDKNARLIFGI